MNKKEKKYYITSYIPLIVDGWVVAKNIKEAKEKWSEFCYNETNGMSTDNVVIGEVLTPKNKYYDKDNVPGDKEFENNDCITYNWLN